MAVFINYYRSIVFICVSIVHVLVCIRRCFFVCVIFNKRQRLKAPHYLCSLCCVLCLFGLLIVGCLFSIIIIVIIYIYIYIYHTHIFKFMFLKATWWIFWTRVGTNMRSSSAGLARA